MIHTRPFQIDDLLGLDIQDWQRQPEFELSREYGEFLLEHSAKALTIIAGDKVLSVGGAIEIWNGRAEIYHLLSKDCGKWMTGIHRESVRFLNEVNMIYPRLETGCEIEWPEAHRWLKMLGFERERRARKYMPSGRDLDIYVRIR